MLLSEVCASRCAARASADIEETYRRHAPPSMPRAPLRPNEHDDYDDTDVRCDMPRRARARAYHAYDERYV